MVVIPAVAKALTALTAALAAAVWTISPALACGMMVSRDGLTELGGFAALISFDGRTEDTVAAIRYSGPDTSFGWVVPLPAKPEITKADPAGLYAADGITTPPHPERGAFGFGAAAPPPAGTVQELGRTSVAGLEFVTLAAHDRAALARWLRSHGFVLRGSESPALQTYLNRGWVIVAARAQPGVTPKAGAIWVRFRFPTRQATYPLALAAAPHAGTLATTFFLVTPYRPSAAGLPETVVRPDSAGFFPATGDRLDLRYSAPLSAADAAEVGRSVTVPKGAWLTRWDSRWDLRTLRQDLVVTRSPVQQKVDYSALAAVVRAERSRELVSTLLLVAGGLLVLIGFIAILFIGMRLTLRRG